MFMCRYMPLPSPIPYFESSNLDWIKFQPFDEDLLHSPSFCILPTQSSETIKKNVLLSAGVITRYEVFLSGPVELQNLSSPAVERRVFSSSGWWDPSVSVEEQLSNRSTVSPPESSATVTGLTAFSTYKIRVVSINVAGSVTSLWSTARTTEGGLYSLVVDVKRLLFFFCMNLMYRSESTHQS